MFCPDCGAEYRPGFAECADCGVALVSTPPPEDRPDPDSKTVEVFKTTDPMMLPIVQSILAGADIDFFVQGEEALGLLPLGPFGSSASGGTLAARVHVFERDEEAVRVLLCEIDETEDVGEAADD